MDGPDRVSDFLCHPLCAEAVQRYIKGAAEESLSKKQELQSQIDRYTTAAPLYMPLSPLRDKSMDRDTKLEQLLFSCYPRKLMVQNGTTMHSTCMSLRQGTSLKEGFSHAGFWRRIRD